jgi:hypothetical protein
MDVFWGEMEPRINTNKDAMDTNEDRRNLTTDPAERDGWTQIRKTEFQTQGNEVTSTLRLSPADPSLPRIIRKLHPDDILVWSNRVSVEIPPERMGGFSVIWEQDSLEAGHWLLEATFEGPVTKIVYNEAKP